MPGPLLPPASLIHEELSRLIDSDTLRRAPSHARLLRYLVERRVAGDDTALRETSIALEVFRRDPSTYDPQTDPIVRVTAGRLRERLASHYARYDSLPKVRIVLPRGSYAPEFVPIAGTAPSAPGIAVLRARNQTGDPVFDMHGGTFADQLSDRLARAGFPRVIARSSVDEAQHRLADVRAIGSRLEVPWLVESTLSREHRFELRLSLRLVDVADGSVRWIETGVAPLDDAHALVDRMVDLGLMRAFETLPVGVEHRGPAPATAPLPDAVRSALERARLLVLQRTVDGTDEALAIAESVVREHDDAAEAWATLAGVLYSRHSFGDLPPQPLKDRIRLAAERALKIDATQPMALRAKAILAGRCDHDLESAEALYMRALRVMPHYTSARLNYAELLSLAGRHDESLVQLNLARLYDPLSASVHLALAICLGYQRRHAEAREAWALCRAAGDKSLWVQLGEGMNELAAGNRDRAAAMVDEASRRLPDLPAVLTSRASVHAARGDHALAIALEQECARRFPHYSPAYRALPAAFRGDRDTVLSLLEAALAEQDMGLLAATVNAAFDWLHDDAGYRALRARCPIWDGRSQLTVDS